MDRPRLRVTVQGAMVGVAVAAVSLAVVRKNLALGIFVACVLCLTIARVIDTTRRFQAAGGRLTIGRRAVAYGSSLVVATLIMGMSEFVFMLCFAVCDPFDIDRQGPLGLSLTGLLVGAGFAVLTAIKLRLWLWPELPGVLYLVKSPRFIPGAVKFTAQETDRNCPESGDVGPRLSRPGFWSAQTEQVVQRLIDESLPASDLQIRAEAERLAALPIGYDLWSYWFLRPSGEVVIVDWEHEERHEEISTAWVRVLSALVGGGKRYPELSKFLPLREPGAEDCPCRQHDMFVSLKVICPECGGVGWLPPKTARRASEL